MTESREGALYVVATPIGNLEDLSQRAIKILSQADLIAAEDTRHSARLLDHLGVRVPMLSLHEHNEAGRIERLRAAVMAGQRVALISDAGTPLISDPGYRVVKALREVQLNVIPVPGPCALIAALSAAGLPTERFRFEGFLPAKEGARRQRLEALVTDEATLVFYESPHRIHALLKDIDAVMAERRIVLARELTKTFETFLDDTPRALLARLESDPNQARGEFVVMIAGAPAREQEESTTVESEMLLDALMEEGVGVKQAANIAARILGGRKKQWYQRLLDRRENG
ncbi:16S rRNA (cytidine(1402)-2'-O)-methyltransferase [Phytohalomonas tamaricis]|uniref:16S rRNA (cytidine(1402)-2'-O)-methyltransferase n=1 Tax=Phytohalomonas tamaricis TaxID=2081032 RepID=UPI000D0B7403|nr:16S rRNA (cytidine(1402)-2'-O)-methyltransferase [Phytohalomonas tamaricis]